MFAGTETLYILEQKFDDSIVKCACKKIIIENDLSLMASKYYNPCILA